MREYRDKGKLVWVNPNVVWYDLEQMEWLLPQLRRLREGLYPPEPSGGYIDSPDKQRTFRAPFEKACLIAAEIDLRLARTGLDRYLVEDKYCKGLSELEIAQNLYMDEFQVYKRIRSAVTYIASGQCPRWLECRDCPLRDKCQKKKRRGISYRDWVRNRRRQWFKHKVPQMR